MRFSIFSLVIFVVALLLPSFGFASYGSNRERAVQWLVARQNTDGSWGANETDKFLNTVETVQALRAAGNRNSSYFKGITWLENHAADNSDFLARGALALGTHGDDLSAEVARLESYQDTSIPGHSAWGVSPAYLQSPLDTAVVLSTLTNLGTIADLGAARNYLKNSQLTGADKGWTVGLESASNAFATAMVVKALVPLQSQDPSLSTIIANGVATLGAKVNSGSPYYLQAFTAYTALLANAATTAQPLLNNLTTAQGVDGSWSGRIYDTALALRAFAAADGTDNGSSQTSVAIPDAGLRTAINASLGRNALDSIDRAELARLTDLNAANMGISNLTGLEWAKNLRSADLRNNKINSTIPLNNLALLTVLQLDGNPVVAAEATDSDIPTLPEWGMIIMACLLIGIGIRHQRFNRYEDFTLWPRP